MNALSSGFRMLQIFGAGQWHLCRVFIIFSGFCCFASSFQHAQKLDFLFAWSGQLTLIS